MGIASWLWQSQTGSSPGIHAAKRRQCVYTFNCVFYFPNTGALFSFQPTAFLQLHTDDHADPNCKIKIAHGTTTLAFRFKGGIIVAVDSRATAGSYIGEARGWLVFHVPV